MKNEDDLKKIKKKIGCDIIVNYPCKRKFCLTKSDKNCDL